MAEKYGVNTNPDDSEVEGTERKTLRRKEGMANMKPCPNCGSTNVVVTSTNTLQCPNCGTLPFER